MFVTKNSKYPFRGVAMAAILFGALILGLSLTSWLFLVYAGESFIHAPFEKVMGGTIIAGIGYIILEIELLRSKE